MAKKRRPNTRVKQPQTKALMPAAAALVTAISDSNDMTKDTSAGQEIEPAKQRLFSLNVEDNPGSPSLRFTWCLSPEVMRLLTSKGIYYPYLLVSLFKKTGDGLENWLEDEARQLLPLDRGFGVIEFTQPGNYLICASIVTCDSNPKNRAQTYGKLCCLTETDRDGDFKTRLTNRHGYYAWDGGSYTFLTPHEQVSVFVDQQFFAPKPADWLWEYVNLWHERTPRDQCMFRRRAMIAVPKTFLVIFYAITVPLISILIAFIMVCGGRRHINWKAIFHPVFNTETDFEKILIPARDLGYESKDKRMYWTNTAKDGKPHSELFTLLARPINWIGMSILPLAATFFVHSKNPYYKLMVFLEILTEMLILVLGVIVIMSLIARFSEWLSTPEKKAKAELEERARNQLAAEMLKRKERARLLRLYGERYEPLTCTTGPHEASLAAVPKSHRTLYLLYLDTKFKVCKPFARSKR